LSIIKKDSLSFLKYFYWLATVFLGLAVSAIYYTSWQNNQLVEMKQVLVEYHEATISETLAIEREITRFEKKIARLDISYVPEEEVAFSQAANRDQFRFSIKESLETITNIQNEYKYPQYQNTLNNIKSHWQKVLSQLDSQGESFSSIQVGSHELPPTFSIVVRQLGRLHFADEEILQIKIRDYTKEKDKKVIFFVAALVLLGGIISFIILRKLKNELKIREEVEKELRAYRNNLENLVEERTAELKKKNEQLVYAEKLTATGKLSASIAHEFNNPLYGIKNVLEEVQDGVEMEPAYKKLVAIGVSECKRIAELIKNLQDFHRPSQGVFESVNINNIVDEVCLLIKTKMKKRKIAFNVNLSDQELIINGVRDQLKQVILNLLQNAEEAITGDEGRISVKSELKDAIVLIEFQDTGSGIDPKIVKSVFEPFFTTKSAVKGTGLGLSICHGIIKAHKGDIDIKSQPGQGTTITISFPSLRTKS